MTDEPSPAPRISRPTKPDRRASLDVRVRFDEATPSGAIRTSALLRYASDLASVDSDRRGYDRAWYRDHGLAWLVRGVDLRILLPIGYGDELVGTTRVVGARKVLARRQTEFRTTDGELAAIVLVDWAMTSAEGVPTRIPDEFAPVFAMAATMFKPVRVRAAAPSDRPTHTLTLSVRPQELDPMDHVNNAVYLDWAEEAIRSADAFDAAEASAANAASATSDAASAANASAPAAAAAAAAAPSPLDALPRRWELEYVRSAAPGDHPLATTWREGTSRCCRIEDALTGEAFLGARLET